METAIGVFVSRSTAEEAVKELLDQGVPKDSINFLTRSDSEAAFREMDTAFVGGFLGGAAGLGAAALTLLAIPGIGQVVAVGVGAAALLGAVGAGTGAALGKTAAQQTGRPQPTEDARAAEDAEFFREVLKQNRSLVVVRTESQEIVKKASGILDRLGIGMQGRTSVRMRSSARQADGVTVLDLSGRITVGEGNLMLREIVHELIGKGNKKVLLNLGEVEYVDSAGIGELVRTFTTLRNQGGQLKLVNVHKKVQDLLEATNLHRVFDIHTDESSAIKSFGDQLGAAATS
jgi:anti-sigma B factor antagonist